jgi:hypothetical protein
VGGNEEAHIQNRVLQLVTLVFVFAQGLNLIDQIKKDKQSQKTERHKTHGSNDFAMDQMTNGSHALAPPITLQRSEKIDAKLFRIEEWNNIVNVRKPQL